jgi:hypothetical protein
MTPCYSHRNYKAHRSHVDELVAFILDGTFMRGACLLAFQHLLLNSSRSLACVTAPRLSQSLPRLAIVAHSRRNIQTTRVPSSSMGTIDKTSIDKEEYDKQWHDTWQSGLPQGQVITLCCSRTHIQTVSHT